MAVKTARPTTRRGARPVERPPAAPAAPGCGAATLMLVSRSLSERARLARLYQEAGFTVLEAADIPGARQMMRAARLDLIVLECPSLIGDELTFCQAVAAGPRVPLLVLAAAADVVDEIVALELGADDLLIGQVAERLVLARTRALARRTRTQDRPAHAGPEEIGRWRLNPVTRAAISPEGRSVQLSPGDASALHLFLTNPGVVFTCEAGAQALGAGARGAQGFRTTVCRLRKKLKPLHDVGPIQTVRGVGYTYAPPEVSGSSAAPSPRPRVGTGRPRRARLAVG